MLNFIIVMFVFLFILLTGASFVYDLFQLDPDDEPYLASQKKSQQSHRRR